MAKATKKTTTKKAPTAKKVAAKASGTKTVKKKTTKKASAPKKAAAKSASVKTIPAQERYHMIDEAAYYRAEKSGFQVDPTQNWIAAEKEIDELLSKQGLTVKG